MRCLRAPGWEAGVLELQLYKETTVTNMIVTLGMAARLSGSELLIPKDIAVLASFYPYITVAKALAGLAAATTTDSAILD